jgi:IS30 family transposase
MNRLIDLFTALPQPARQSITFDRGFEFTAWRELKKGMGTEAWFCDPQALWQKGSVENLNKRARCYLQREIAVGALSAHAMNNVCDRLNGTPRKCLGYRTPRKGFSAELSKIT